MPRRTGGCQDDLKSTGTLAISGALAQPLPALIAIHEFPNEVSVVAHRCGATARTVTAHQDFRLTKPIASAKYYAKRFGQHIRENGLRGAVVLVGKNLIWPYCEWLIRHRIQAHEQFDLKYGLDTQTPILIRDLEIWAPAAQYAVHYEGAPIPLIHRILRQLRTDLRRFTLIDLGSGKGRVLLVAAQYPFKSVIGLEFSKILHDIAQANISKFVEQGLTKTRPRSINMDASEFDFSQFTDKVIFCNNPFIETFALRILDNLQSSLRKTGHEGILIYLSPIPPAVKERLDAFHLIAQGSYLSHFGGFQKYYIYRITS
jgi:SAM-dependent methyltransferase